MQIKNSFPHSFIDLAKMGRTDWRSVALTILSFALLMLLVKFLMNVFAAIAVLLQLVVAGRLMHTWDAEVTVVLKMGAAAGYIFGFQCICRKILRRPFRSLISTDMTFDIRRCLLGAALCLPANAVSLSAFWLFFSIKVGAPIIRQFEWPHAHQIVVSTGMLIVVPFLAFIEELFFRAWLSQTLVCYIRSTIVVVALIAVLFAAAHPQYDFLGRMQIAVVSLGLSALSLRHQRLELAIGAHSMMNICSTLQALFFTGALPHVQSPVTTLDSLSIVIFRGVIPYALIYGLMQITKAWYVPNDDRLANLGDIDPG